MSNSHITIRPAKETEYSALGAITVRAYEAVPGAIEDDRDFYRDVLRDVAARAKSSDILVAIGADGKLLGGVAYVPDSSSEMAEWDLPNVGGFRMLAVDPFAQSLGVGRKLIDACIARAREDGRDALVLHTTPELKTARALYERLGFQREQSLDQDLGFVTLLGYLLPLK